VPDSEWLQAGKACFVSLPLLRGWEYLQVCVICFALQMLGSGGWEQCTSALEPAVVQRLARYGV
jgi:hypothetical protein